MEDPDFMAQLNALRATEPERAANLVTTFTLMLEPVQAPEPKRKRRFSNFSAGQLAMSTSDESSSYQQTNRKAGGRLKRQRTQGEKEATKSLLRYRRIIACCFQNDEIVLAEVLAATTEYRALSQHDRKEWRMNKCLSMNGKKKGFGIRTANADVSSCCTDCFANYHGFSRRTISRTLSLIKEHRLVIPVVKVPNRSVARQEALAWVTNKYLHFGDYMPDEATICLPVYDKKELFNWYNTSEEVYDKYQVNEFNKLLREHFPFITCRRCTKFMQCAWCNKVDILISKTKVLAGLHLNKYTI